MSVPQPSDRVTKVPVRIQGTDKTGYSFDYLTFIVGVDNGTIRVLGLGSLVAIGQVVTLHFKGRNLGYRVMSCDDPEPFPLGCVLALDEALSASGDLAR